MKLFLDTNILIDVIANRKPWVDEALVLFELAKQKKLTLIVADFSFINLAYITRKLFTQEELYALFSDLCLYVKVVEVGGMIIKKSFQKRWKDMEDCVQYLVAKREEADYLITRNEKDFSDSDIPVLSPSEFLDMIL